MKTDKQIKNDLKNWLKQIETALCWKHEQLGKLIFSNTVNYPGWLITDFCAKFQLGRKKMCPNLFAVKLLPSYRIFRELVFSLLVSSCHTFSVEHLHHAFYWDVAALKWLQKVKVQLEKIWCNCPQNRDGMVIF